MDDKNKSEELPTTQDQSSPPLRKSTNKSTMEKKRRERINRSLTELKSLVLGSIKKDASYYSKLEKADILEMTVDHVRFLQTQLQSAHTSDGLDSVRYRAGFATCATEMTSLLTSLPGIDETVKYNLLKNLNDKCGSSTITLTNTTNGINNHLNYSSANPVFYRNPYTINQHSTRDNLTRCKENIHEIHERYQSVVNKPERKIKRKADTDDCPVLRKTVVETKPTECFVASDKIKRKSDMDNCQVSRKTTMETKPTESLSVSDKIKRKADTDDYMVSRKSKKERTSTESLFVLDKTSISTAAEKIPVTSFLPLSSTNNYINTNTEDVNDVWRPW